VRCEDRCCHDGEIKGEHRSTASSVSGAKAGIISEAFGSPPNSCRISGSNPRARRSATSPGLGLRSITPTPVKIEFLSPGLDTAALMVAILAGSYQIEGRIKAVSAKNANSVVGAPWRHADGRWRGLFIGVERKSSVHGQTGAIVPNGQSTECPLFQPTQTCQHWVLHHNDETWSRMRRLTASQ